MENLQETQKSCKPNVGFSGGHTFPKKPYLRWLVRIFCGWHFRPTMMHNYFTVRSPMGTSINQDIKRDEMVFFEHCSNMTCGKPKYDKTYFWCSHTHTVYIYIELYRQREVPNLFQRVRLGIEFPLQLERNWKIGAVTVAPGVGRRALGETWRRIWWL